MANVTQIYALVNAVASEALGQSAIVAKNTSSFISLGDQILSTSTNRDAFYNRLPDVIGRAYIKYKAYEIAKDKRIYKTPLEFGMALQKIQTGSLAQAKNNDSWAQNPDPFADGVDDTDVVCQIFAKRGTFSIDKVIYDYQLDTAFKSESDFGSFVNLVFQDMYNAMENDLHQLSKLCVATAIATCINAESTHPTVSRNLLKEYNDAHTSATLTVAEALESLPFLKFASRQINLAVKRMREMSSLFNSAGADRFTSEGDVVVEILSDFATATSSYLESDTYHKELVALPMYAEINSWQGTGTDYGFDSTSSINITAGDGSQQFTVEANGVIAFVRDVEKCGIMYDRVRTKSMYNATGERTHYSHKCDKGYYVDTTENGVVFYLAEDSEDSM